MSNLIWTVSGERKYLTANEVRKFIEGARKYEDGISLFCEFLAVSGCRISEALSVCEKNFNFIDSKVVIETLKKRKCGIFREIPIPKGFINRLKAHICAKKIRDKSRIWSFTRMTAYRYVVNVMHQAGLKGVHASPKGLRHGFAIEAIQSGVPLNIVQRWLGHASMATTAIYTAAIGPEERRLADRMWLVRQIDASDNGLDHGSSRQSKWLSVRRSR